MFKKMKISKAVVSTILLTSVSSFAAPKIESVPGEFIVRLKKDVITTKSLRTLSERLGAKIKSTIPGQNIVVVQRPVFEKLKSLR